MPNPFRHILTKSLTETQQDLYDNYIPQAREEETAERRKWQPLRMLLDLLSRGQYVTANIAEAMTRRNRGERGEGTKIGQAAWQGVTGKKKGDWQDVIFGREGGEEGDYRGWVDEATRERWEKPVVKWKGRGGKDRGLFRPAKMVGFAANVLLDPLTYVGFGPSKAARAGKRIYQDDVVKVLNRMARNPEELVKLTRGTTKAGVPTDALEPFAKMLAREYRGAGKKFLRTPAKELREDMGEKVGKLISGEEEGLLKKLLGMGDDVSDDVAEKMVGDWKRSMKPFEDIQQSLGDLYKHGGERAWRVPGKEYNVGVRKPWAGRRTMDWMKERFTTSEFGHTLSDAWFAMTNKGVAGKARELGDEIRKSLNVLNPYEKSLRLRDLDITARGRVTSADGAVDVWKVASDDALNKQVVAAYNRAAELAEATPGFQVDDLVKMQDEMTKLGIQDPEAVRNAYVKVRQMTDEMYYDELVAVKEGIIPELKFRENYLPGVTKGQVANTGGARAAGTAKPGFTKPRTYLPTERVEHEVGIVMNFFKKTEAEAREFVLKHNLGEFSTDLRQMLMYRVQGHARMMKYVDTVKQFREFGIPIENLGALTKQATGLNQGLPQLGLRKVPGEAFDGLLFDDSVAEIIERVVKGTTTELPKTKKVMAGFMSWWRGIVTLSPGFHIRNHISNSITGFTVHGWKWFDLERTADAYAGVIYALNRTNPKKALEEAGLSLKWYYERLNNVRGGKTIREWADEAMNRSVVSTATMGFDPLDYADELAKKTSRGRKAVNLAPVGNDNIWFRGSHAVGNRIENTPRFKSFLIDVEDAYAGRGAATQGMDVVSPGMVPGTPEFTESFGRSVVVNADGSPKVVYHGTSAQPSAAFVDNEQVLGREGFFFTTDKEYAEKMAKRSAARRGGDARVDSYYLRLERPNPSGASPDAREAFAGQEGLGGKFDGWIDPAGGKANEIVVFDPSQIIPTAETQRLLSPAAPAAGARSGGDMARMADEAAYNARRWWLDYGDLTDTERMIKNNLVPFYTWIRKNLANQVSGIFMYPEIYSMYPKLQELATLEDPDFNADLIPDWMKDLGAFPIQREDTGEYTFFNPNIPLQDINRIPLMFAEGDYRIGTRRPQLAARELVDDIVEMSSPLVKQVVSWVNEKGYDAFYKRDLDYYGKAPFVFRLFTKSPKMVSFLDRTVKLMGGNGLGLRVNERTGKMEMDASIAKLLETNLPVLRTIDRLVLTGTALIPGMEEAMEQATGATDDYGKLEAYFQWQSWYLGIKRKAVDMEEARREYGSDILERAEKERNRVRSGQPIPRGAVSSSTRWQDQQQARKEKLGLP